MNKYTKPGRGRNPSTAPTVRPSKLALRLVTGRLNPTLSQGIPPDNVVHFRPRGAGKNSDMLATILCVDSMEATLTDAGRALRDAAAIAQTTFAQIELRLFAAMLQNVNWFMAWLEGMDYDRDTLKRVRSMIAYDAEPQTILDTLRAAQPRK